MSESGGHRDTCEKDFLLAACVLGYHHQSVLNSRGLSVKEEGLPKKENNNKEKKKVSEESCFPRKQRAIITTSVFAFLANESTALL